MAHSKPSLVPLSELIPGQHADFFALLTDKTRGKTREGKAYFSCRFRDKARSVSFMVWNDGPWFGVCESDWQPGQFYKIRGSYGEHERDGPQLIEIENIREVQDADRATGFDPAQLVESSRLDPAVMFAELKQIATEQIGDEPLRRLVTSLLDTHAEPLQRLPATRDRFYPFAGGLIEHTLNVTRSCLELAKRYSTYYTELHPPLNIYLIVAAAILHDIGRVMEFGDEAIAPSVTVAGRLSGHLILGRDFVREAAQAQGDVNPELIQILEHILLTHLALPEWGSPRLPLVPECLIVHHADDLDAKLEMYAHCLSRDKADGPFTDREPGLNRQLFKGRSV